MTKKLSTDQLMALERLSGKEYTLDGARRKKPRTQKENQKLGITDEHIHHLYGRHLDGIKSIQLRKLLLSVKDQWHKKS